MPSVDEKAEEFTDNELKLIAITHSDPKVKRATGMELVDRCIAKGDYIYLREMAKNELLPEEVRKAAEEGIETAAMEYIRICTAKDTAGDPRERHYMHWSGIANDRELSENVRNAAEEGIETAAMEYIRKRVANGDYSSVYNVSTDRKLSEKVRQAAKDQVGVAAMEAVRRFSEECNEKFRDSERRDIFRLNIDCDERLRIAKWSGMFSEDVRIAAGMEAVKWYAANKESDKLHSMAKNKELPEAVRIAAGTEEIKCIISDGDRQGSLFYLGSFFEIVDGKEFPDRLRKIAQDSIESVEMRYIGFCIAKGDRGGLLDMIHRGHSEKVRNAAQNNIEAVVMKCMREYVDERRYWLLFDGVVDEKLPEKVRNAVQQYAKVVIIETTKKSPKELDCDQLLKMAMDKRLPDDMRKVIMKQCAILAENLKPTNLLERSIRELRRIRRTIWQSAVHYGKS